MVQEVLDMRDLVLESFAILVPDLDRRGPGTTVRARQEARADLCQRIVRGSIEAVGGGQRA
eukprot:3264837-Alexandrium_andersonii.AAC.1